MLKSIFEEEIAFEYEDILKEAESKGYNLDQFDYYDYKIKEDNIDKYTTLINESKKNVSIVDYLQRIHFFCSILKFALVYLWQRF